MKLYVQSARKRFFITDFEAFDDVDVFGPECGEQIFIWEEKGR